MPEVVEEEAARPPRIRPTIWRLGFVAMAFATITGSALAYVSGLPAIFDRVEQLDKVVHFGVFGSLAFFLDAVLRRRMLRVGAIAVPLAAVLVLVPAAIEEFCQRFSTNRTSDIFDFAADLAGVTVLVFLSRRLDA
jgi:hypothetical protein